MKFVYPKKYDLFCYQVDAEHDYRKNKTCRRRGKKGERDRKGRSQDKELEKVLFIQFIKSLTITMHKVHIYMV